MINEIFKIKKQLESDNQDMVGDKCVKDDTCNLSIDNKTQKFAWKQHCECLLNEEFFWDFESLTAEGLTVVGPPILITIEKVAKTIMKTKNGKAAGPSGIVAKMLKGPSDTGVRLLADFANNMIRNGTIPSDWENSFIISTYKGKGDALIRDKYRGLKHLDHVMKVIERVMEKIIREICSLASCRDGAELMKYSS